MALAARSFDPAPERRPGDFRRKGTGGPPYVSSPTKTRQPKGNKPELAAKVRERGIDLTDFDFDNYDGVNPMSCTVDQLKAALGPEPADELYGRPSGFGDPLENAYALRKHIERQKVAGTLRLVLAGLDPSTVDLDDPAVLDRLVLEADAAADAMIWADRGTHVHLIVEHIETGRAWEHLIPAGEALGIPAPLQQRVAEQWVAFRRSMGARSLASELTLVNDELRIAGTTDLLDVFDHDLELPVADGTYVVTAGQAVIGDVKTGELRPKYAVQIVGYADGVPYDTDAETRAEWPVEPHQGVGLIWHYNLRAALDGELVEWEAIPVDLAVGRAGARICCEARDWPASSPFGQPIAAPSPFGAGDAADEPRTVVEQRAAVEPNEVRPSSAPAAEIAESGAGSPAAPPPATDEGAAPPAVAPSSGSRRDALRERRIRMERNAIDTGWHVEFLAAWNAKGITRDSTDDEIEAALDSIEAPFDPDPAPPRGITRPQAATAVDVDGDVVTSEQIDSLLAVIRAVDTVSVVNGWLAQADAVGRSWDPRTRRRARQLEITRAASCLAQATDGDDELARVLLAAVIDDQSIIQPAFVVGVTLAALTIDEARTLAELSLRLSLVKLERDVTPADVAALLAAA